jgi:xanthine dehydrogenase YagS FAD-binding subunit
MIHTFKHINPTTVADASAALLQYGKSATLIAGGTDLLPQLHWRVRPEQPGYVVNLKNVPGLDYIKEDATGLKIGALTRLHDIAFSTTVLAKYSALAQAARRVGSWQLRNMATLGGDVCQQVWCWYLRVPRNKFYCIRKGGSLCQAIAGDNRYLAILGDPTCPAASPSDCATALLALNATMVTNKRKIGIADFFTNLGTSLQAGEIVTEIDVPTPPAGSKQGFDKITIRKQIDFAIVSAAVLITPASGTITSARVALGAVAPIPWRATKAEAALIGQTLSPTVAAAAAAAAVDGAKAMTMNKYKIQMAAGITKRVILA